MLLSSNKHDVRFILMWSWGTQGVMFGGVKQQNSDVWSKYFQVKTAKMQEKCDFGGETAFILKSGDKSIGWTEVN